MVASALVLLAGGCARVGTPAAGDPAADRPRAADTVRVLAYNIHHGEGMDSVIDLRRVAELILKHDPDLVALQEIDSVVARTNGVDQAAELGRLTGMTAVFGRFMPYQGGAYGMALLSRWPIRSTVNHRLPDGAEPRSALEAVVVSPTTGQEIRFVGVHFYRTEEERSAQADTLDARLFGGVDAELPTILAGDFNSEPRTRVIDDRARRWVVIDKGEDRLTYSSFDPVREIDFVMVHPGPSFRVLDEYVVDEPVISDHRPLVVVLAVTR
ncbi:MAG: endonuclease [Gemmatimonadetes bacterium]|nr:endonuclease [Gemmatimonadota bacterium]